MMRQDSGNPGNGRGRPKAEELCPDYVRQTMKAAADLENRALQLRTGIGQNMRSDDQIVVSGDVNTYPIHARVWMVKICGGDLGQAVVLGQLIYRCTPIKGQAVCEGGQWWLWKGREALAAELGTTPKRCRTALDALIRLGVIVTRSHPRFKRQLRIDWGRIDRLRREMGC